MPPGPVRVLVAGPRRLFREGLSLILSLLPRVEVAGTAADGDVLALALALAPDVVIMDLRPPGCGGLETARRLAEVRPGLAVVALTGCCDDHLAGAAQRAGVRGVITEDAGTADVFWTLMAVAAGETELDPAIRRQVAEDILRHGGTGPAGMAGLSVTGSSAAMVSPPAAPCRAPSPLTAREAEVLAEIGAGRSNTEIAMSLSVSTTTVKTHVNHLLAKTGQRDRAQLVAYAFRLGLARLTGHPPEMGRVTRYTLAAR